MQIVIEMDENLYTRLFDTEAEYIEDMHEACVAIRKGKPLPKGHGRLIDVDAIPGDSSWDFADRLDETPTITEADKAEREGE